MKEELAALASMNATIAALARACPTFWVNPEKLPFSEAKKNFALGSADIRAADARMERFAPFVAARFPETAVSGGRIVSPLTEIPRMSASLGVRGRMFLKQDNALAVAGSVKARGGIYEVLCHTEDLIRQNGLLPEDVYKRQGARAHLVQRRSARRQSGARHAEDRKSTRLNSSHVKRSRMPSSA